MTALVLWLERKKAALCLLSGILCISLFVIINSNEKITENKGGTYAVKIRHYGIDAAEMERTITIPLEDALYAIPGLLSVSSSSENSLSTVFIRFKPGAKGRYEAVRDAAQKVYETLPSSVQRPEILNSGSSRIPVWSAAVYSDGAENNKENIMAAQTLEKILKPRLESLEGAGEVIVSGTGLKQIFIILDQEKISSIGLDPSSVASSLGMNDSIFSGGSVVQQNREFIITVDGRYGYENTNVKYYLEKALIPFGSGKSIELSEIAQVTEQERMPDILSRLNGRKTTSIAIMGRHEADLRRLSFDIKKELSFLPEPLEIIVLSDLGAEEALAFRSVLKAALTGAIMVAIISFLLNRNNFGISVFFCTLAIPLICIISMAILSLAGMSINRLMLAGIAAGLGTAVDSVILCSEKFSRRRTYISASKGLLELSNPLIAGAATTVAVLLPLSAIEENGARIIAGSISVITIVSLVLSLTLLPPLLLWNTGCKNKSFCFTFFPDNLREKLSSVKRRLTRFFARFFLINIRFCVRNPLVVLSVSLLLVVLAIFMLFGKGVDTGNYGSEDSVYAQIEFDGGLLAEEIDRLLSVFGEQLAGNAGIKNVETGARTGSASLLVSFDSRKTKPHYVRELVRSIPVPGGFVFFPENSSKDRYWEIKIFGEEENKCRELAEELAYICAVHPLIRERVLNFKQGSRKMILLPDRELLAETGIVFSNAAVKVRQGVYGPVAYKRTGSDGEVDVRIMTGGRNLLFNETDSFMQQTREDTLDLLVPFVTENSTGAISISSLTKIREEIEPSSLRRDDRRRTASITITTKPMDPRRVKRELSPLLEKLDLPPGYSIEFDPDAIKQAHDLSITLFSLVIAIIFCYMIMAAINESFLIPLIVLAAVPPSLSVPALCLVMSGYAYNSAIACAFIAVSGMTVNAAIICVDSLKLLKQNGKSISASGIYLCIRKKLPVLLSITSTTIAAAVPFLFLGEEANAFIKTMSLTGALGVACSFICSITVIPSLFFLTKKLSYQL